MLFLRIENICFFSTKTSKDIVQTKPRKYLITSSKSINRANLPPLKRKAFYCARTLFVSFELFFVMFDFRENSLIAFVSVYAFRYKNECRYNLEFLVILYPC